jgi:hypothetical protein
MPTPHEKLRIAQARRSDAAWVKKLLEWIESSTNADENLLKTELAVWVEEYSPQIQMDIPITQEKRIYT